MERFDGLALLTTNLRSNVDEAFTRRLDVIIDFPFPDDDDRRRLWELNVHRGVPLDGDLDLPFLARSFRLSGGNIRNIVFTAAYLAAGDGGMLTMEHLIRGTQREYRKLGRLCVPEEFGPYYSLIADGATSTTGRTGTTASAGTRRI
jgi:SpoVK/Ycf46/Vps4 family AAA+-type ATPase